MMALTSRIKTFGIKIKKETKNIFAQSFKKVEVDMSKKSVRSADYETSNQNF